MGKKAEELAQAILNSLIANGVQIHPTESARTIIQMTVASFEKPVKKIEAESNSLCPTCGQDGCLCSLFDKRTW